MAARPLPPLPQSPQYGALSSQNSPSDAGFSQDLTTENVAQALGARVGKQRANRTVMECLPHDQDQKHRRTLLWITVLLTLALVGAIGLTINNHFGFIPKWASWIVLLFTVGFIGMSLFDTIGLYRMNKKKVTREESLPFDQKIPEFRMYD
jgi:hypothetical protein